MSLELSEVLQPRTENGDKNYSDDSLCEMANQISAGSRNSIQSSDSYNMMKALADGGLLLRAGRLIKLEDRTSQKRLMA